MSPSLSVEKTVSMYDWTTSSSQSNINHPQVKELPKEQETWTVAEEEDEEDGENDDYSSSELSSLEDDCFEREQSCNLMSSHRFVDSTLELVGHEEEIDVLRKAFERVESQGMSEAIVIRGSSGVGKSKLIDQLRDEFVDRHPDSFFVVGKFDQFRNDPFSAVMSAFADLVDLILQSHSAETLRTKIMEQLGDFHLSDFIQVISGLERLCKPPIRVSNEARESEENRLISTTEAFKRFKVNAPLFLRALSSRTHPIIFCLDDVQWADSQSRQVIRSLWKDGQSKHILFLCLHREECSETRKFFRLTSPLPIDKITLQNFKAPQVRHLLRHVLRKEQLDHVFVDTVIQRTDGNPEKILQFLDMMKAESLLKYDGSNTTWRWDLEEIQKSSLDLSVVQGKIALLSKSVQSILSIASFLGQDFEEAMLEIIITESASPSRRHQSKPRMKQALHLALEEGLIERINGGHFRFAQNVHHVLYNLIDDEAQREQLHLMIGRFLSKAGISLLLAVADHMNLGSAQLDREEERVDLANINLEAAKVAINESSFVGAKDYLKNGVNMLNSSRMWDDHYQLSVELCSSAAQMTYLTGNFDEADEMISTVLEKASVLSDRVRVYHTKINLSLARGKIDEAVKVGLDTLRLLGEAIPEDPKQIPLSRQINRVRRLMRSKKTSHIATMPVMDDPKLLNICQLLAETKKACLFGGNALFGTYASLRLVELSLLHGLNKHLPEGLIQYAVVLEHQPSEEYAELAHELIMDERLEAQHLLSRVHTVSYSMLKHWGSPLRDCLGPLQKAYDHRLRVSDGEFAGFAGVNVALIQFHSGLSLRLVEESFRDLVKRMKNLKQENSVFFSVPFWQMVLNFMGRSEHAVILSGRAMSEGEFLRQTREARHEVGVTTCRFASLILSVHFGALVQAEEALDELEGTVENKLRGHFHLYYYQFYAGMAYILLANKSGQRRYRQKANNIIRQMSKFNCVNVEPLLQFLKAERMKCKNADRLISVFSAASTRVPHMEAFVKERLGLRLMEMGDPRARGYLQKAQEMYRRWGGEAKASYLKRKLLQLGK